MAESIPLAPKQICEPHRRSLLQIVDEMPGKPSAEHLVQRTEKTTEVLKSYGAQIGNYLESQEREAKAVIGAVAQFTEKLSGYDQRYAVRLQGITKKLKLLAGCHDLGEMRARLNTEVSQLEACMEERQRESQSLVSSLHEDVNGSELRKQRGLPGPGSQHASDSLLTLDRAIRGWDRFCLVRYDFRDRTGKLPDLKSWRTLETGVQEALPERLGHPVRVVVAKPGIVLAAVQCQLLEYAGQAEAMEQTLTQSSGLVCTSRVVEPLLGEAMREAMARLEKAG